MFLTLFCAVVIPLSLGAFTFLWVLTWPVESHDNDPYWDKEGWMKNEPTSRVYSKDTPTFTLYEKGGKRYRRTNDYNPVIGEDLEISHNLPYARSDKYIVRTTQDRQESHDFLLRKDEESGS